MYVRKELIERIEKLLRKTKSRMRIGGRIGGEFWTARGLRQGCLLRPMLFNLLIADLKEELARVRWGGVKLGGRG